MIGESRHHDFTDLLADPRWPPDEQNAPEWWPAGASAIEVYRCYVANGCEGCGAVLEALRKHYAGLALDGQHAALSAFAAGGVAGP